MRWAMLYYFYIFMIQLRAPKIHIQNYNAFHNLDEQKILYSDKTGTITEVGLEVANLTDVKLENEFAFQCELVLVVLMANNDSQKTFCVDKVNKSRPGTSPEEIAIADYLESKGITITSNPVKPGSLPEETTSADQLGSDPESRPCIAVHEEPLVLRQCRDGRCFTISCNVLSRTDFQPALGYRQAIISFRMGEKLKKFAVRQGGADIMA
eukprot:CAMPEP_0169396396 /NCGR_PEP_ID=MMETSP1017-20121227/51322_1 /TAXON_ID=342587 /ORGANISM="Karlodinium micrum, Strain CCMP2283" /LENGTH=209 /DNA_ID=CAMNT_0009500785 /DNA_START=95 /DNA_END=721 /DNA_ORIENTATION=+